MISTLLPIMSAIVILATAVLTAVLLLRRYLRARGPRVVNCPADDSQACVEVAALRSLLGSSDLDSLRLSSCSHWPERAGCGQECLEQLATSPDGCLVRNILAGWYENKTCVLCGKAFGQLDWMEHKPCLLAPDRATRDWSSIHPLELSETLTTHLPVCWNCHIAMTFRREHPELVTDRPWKR